jgi:hypothetical protein
MASKFGYDPDELTRQAKVKAGTMDDKLTGSDWMGFGLQVGGALLDDNAKRKAAKEQMEREDKLLAMQRLDRGRDRIQDAKTTAEQLRMQNRTQNMQGLNFLNQLSEQNSATARSRSFRNAVLGAAI